MIAPYSPEHTMTRAADVVRRVGAALAHAPLPIAHARTRDDWTRAAGTAAACVRIARMNDDGPAQAFGQRCQRYAQHRERVA